MSIPESSVNILLNYLRDVIYKPQDADLDINKLSENIKDFANGFQYFTECVLEATSYAMALSRGDLNCKAPSCDNELAAPLKSLHASLKHLTWQAEQIAFGDYSQRVDFMGDFSKAFNMMVEQLSERQRKLENRAYHDSATQLFNRTFGMLTLDNWLKEKKSFVLIFIDLDFLKRINDEFGHYEGDVYIMNAAKHLKTFSENAVVCRIGGDEFMLLVPDISYDEANAAMKKMRKNFVNDEYLANKTFSYSLSFGIVLVDGDNTMPASEILTIADKRMYENKRKRKKERNL